MSFMYIAARSPTSFMNSLKKLGLRASVSGTFASSTQ